MSTLEQNALENAFRLWKDERMPTDTDSKAFEIFTLEQILKDHDLSDDEIAFGNSGGGGDGGVDGFFFFIDRQLVREDQFTPKAGMGAELTMVQSTRTPGFDEGKMDKLEKFCRYLLDWEDLSSKKNLSQLAKDNMMRFRTNYEKLMAREHSLSVNLHYASRSNHPPSSNVLLRVEELKAYIQGKLSKASVTFTPWGNARLIDALRSNPRKKLVLRKIRELSMSDKSIVCLSTVADFASFLNDGNGNLMTWIMEPNVRDYLGNNQVNKQIRASLNSATWTEDFWWLNNGVTILADDCSSTGDQVTIDNPEIVNGLQTSWEIFKARANLNLSNRHVLVKIIVAPEDRAKNAIIKATNSQTSVSPVSLKATDPIQFDIEDRLLRCGLFYDRRKGKYRRLKKPIKDIVSIAALGQAIIAAYLQQPSDSRARPETVLNNEKTAPSVFNEAHGLDFFAACILIDRRCAEFVDATEFEDSAKVDLRYYVTMLATCELCEKSQPSAQDISELVTKVQNRLDNCLLQLCFDQAWRVYIAEGGTDKTAKGREMETKLKAEIQAKFPPVV